MKEATKSRPTTTQRRELEIAKRPAPEARPTEAELSGLLIAPSLCARLRQHIAIHGKVKRRKRRQGRRIPLPRRWRVHPARPQAHGMRLQRMRMPARDFLGVKAFASGNGPEKPRITSGRSCEKIERMLD